MGFRVDLKKIFLSLALVAILAGCMQRGGGGDSGLNFGDDGGGLGPIDQDPGIDFGSNNGGSGSGGQLSQNDIDALNKLFSETAQADVAPDSPAAQELYSKLETYIGQLLEQRRQGREITAQLMAIAGQLIVACTARAAVLDPFPGYTLLGKWETTESNAKCKVQFTVQGPGPLQAPTTNKYPVSGQTNGAMVAEAQKNSQGGGWNWNGIGVVQANPWSGNLRDTPQAGNGVLRHPAFTPATGGKNPQPAKACDAPVRLTASANPIPANYDEMLNQFYCCFSHAVSLMNPTMVRLLSNADPRLAMLLVQRTGCGGQQGQSKQ